MFLFLEELKNCFTSADMVFAGQYYNVNHVHFMLFEASKLGFCFADIEIETRALLERKFCSIEHIEEQIKRMKEPINYI